MALTPRQVADAYVDKVVQLDPITATMLGLPEGQDRLPDLSPAGLAAITALERETLAELEAVEQAAGGVNALDPTERICARLLRERLTANLALADADERLASLDTLQSPLHQVRLVFTLMPKATDDDWAVIGRRLLAVPDAIAGFQATLAAGMARGLGAGPSQAPHVVAQLDTWLGGPDGLPWFTEFVTGGPEDQRGELVAAAAGVNVALERFRDWLRDEYGPWTATHGHDPVGAERYARFVRFWTGSDLDLHEAYTWAWADFARIDAEMRAEAERLLPGADPATAMTWLNEHGEAVEGVEQVRAWLQDMMDQAISALDDGTFELAAPVRQVEAMIAPEGSAAAPYYTPPAMDFSRPGRTWYHEGVPGHHLQLAQWVLKAPQLSRYQTTVGMISANVEGWALYAERLMDELGFLRDAGTRIGYLDAQRFRAVRVIIDIGMHLELEIPADQGTPEPFAPGERWTPALARRFLGANSGRPEEFLDSELIRYLGLPGQAIGYKLGERAWLAGRSAAEQAHTARGEKFDLRAWHMAALSAGSLGLDDLFAELSVL
jgi:uncharacterized protein (DUF885 family)